MNRIFYLSGLQVLVALILILAILPFFFIYVVAPLLILFLIVRLVRGLYLKIFPAKVKPTHRSKQAWGRGVESGPIIDV